MPQSLSKVYIHLIFSTKNREKTLREEIRPDLHAYIGGILRDLDSPSIEINTEPDHAHVLFILSRTHTISDLVGQAKRGSSAWLKTRDRAYSQFHWQNGFGAFSVSQSGLAEVKEYIRSPNRASQESELSRRVPNVSETLRNRLRRTLRVGLNLTAALQAASVLGTPIPRVSFGTAEAPSRSTLG